MLKNKNLVQYLALGFKEVEGWCGEQVFTTLDLLDSLDINKIGGCLEIGIHHGQSYMLLNQVIDAGATSYAVDIFDNQEMNIDRSGVGSLAIFKSNLEKYDIHKGANTVSIVGDSTDPSLKLEEVVGVGSMRFISIDGGHTPEHTVSDLNLACRLINNQGVVILDDVLHHHWPGVMEGVGRFLHGYPTLVPFALGHNKLYLCKISYQAYYVEAFSKCSLATRPVVFYGHRIIAL